YADQIAVKVTELAGGLAFITPGRTAGIVPGTKVRIHGHTFVVSEVTEKTAAIRLDRNAVELGDTGTAQVTRGAGSAVKLLAKPRAAELFVGQWPDPVHPAETQTPKPVPLGNGRAPGRTHVTVIGRGYGVTGDGSTAGDLEGRVIATFDVVVDKPLAPGLDIP